MKNKHRTKNDIEVEVDVDVRETMSHLPVPSWLITWITGKPEENEIQYCIRTGLSHILTAFAWLLMGIALSILGTTFIGLLPLVLLGWIFTVSGARKLITTINHYCVHGDLLPKSLREKYNWLHAYIAEFNSAILFLQDFQSYKEEHTEHHGAKVTATIVDPDMAFMWQLGFKAGMTTKELWKVLLLNIFNPFSKLHYLFIVSRVKTTLLKSNTFRAIVQFGVILLLVLLGVYTSFWIVLIAVVFPLTYLYHIASLLQFASEHLWLAETEHDGTLSGAHGFKPLLNRSKRITNGRFSGEPFPSLDGKPTLPAFVLVGRWTLRMLFIHLPLRLFVLPGDLPAHDWHHRTKFGSDWPNALYSRAKMAKDFANSEFPFTEVWGLKNALDLVFSNLAQMEPIDPSLIVEEEYAVMGM